MIKKALSNSTIKTRLENMFSFFRSWLMLRTLMKYQQTIPVSTLTQVAHHQSTLPARVQIDHFRSAIPTTTTSATTSTTSTASKVPSTILKISFHNSISIWTKEISLKIASSKCQGFFSFWLLQFYSTYLFNNHTLYT